MCLAYKMLYLWKARNLSGGVTCPLKGYVGMNGGEEIVMEPGEKPSYSSISEELFQKGLKMWRDHRPEEAYEHFGHCLSIDPENAPAYSARAGLSHWLGSYSEALDDISKAIALRPDHAGYLHNRAVILTSLRREAEAIRDYESTLSMEPCSAGTLNNLAWLLSTASDPGMRDCRRAISCAIRAVNSCRSGSWLDTLATAYAECGEFDRAIEIEMEAYAMSKPPNQAFRKRIELYRRRIKYTTWLEKNHDSG